MGMWTAGSLNNCIKVSRGLLSRKSSTLLDLKSNLL